MRVSQSAQSNVMPGLQVIADNLLRAVGEYEAVVHYVLEHAKTDIRAVYAGSVPYLMLTGYVLGGWHMARAALVCARAMQGLVPVSAQSPDQMPDIFDTLPSDFAQNKFATAVFYCGAILPRVETLSRAIHQGVALTQVLEHSTLMN